MVRDGNNSMNDDPYTIKATVTETFSNIEIESNNTISEATTIANEALTGQLSSSSDIDYYSFTVNGEGKINVNFDPTINSRMTILMFLLERAKIQSYLHS